MPLADQLLAFYRLDGSAADSSGAGRDLTPAFVSYAAGLIGQAAAGGNASRSPFDAGRDWRQPWSLQAWVQVAPGAAPGGGGGRVVVDDGSDSVIDLSVNGDDLAPDYELVYNARGGLATYAQAVGAGWRQALATYDGASVRFYLDGSLVAGPSAVAMPATAQNLRAFFDGDFATPFDLVGIWGRALAAGEVATLYNAGAGLDPTAVVPGGFVRATAGGAPKVAAGGAGAAKVAAAPGGSAKVTGRAGIGDGGG